MLDQQTVQAIIVALEMRERQLVNEPKMEMALHTTRNAIKQMQAIQSGREVAIWWSIDDVYSFGEDFEGNTTIKITEAEALQTLANFKDHHDGSMEAMWDDLRYHFDEVIEQRGDNHED